MDVPLVMHRPISHIKNFSGKHFSGLFINNSGVLKRILHIKWLVVLPWWLNLPKNKRVLDLFEFLQYMQYIALPYSSLLPLFSQSISSEPSKQSLVPSQIHLTGTQICWSYLHLKEFSLHTKLDVVSLQNNRKFSNCFILANWVIEHILNTKRLCTHYSFTRDKSCFKNLIYI